MKNSAVDAMDLLRNYVKTNENYPSLLDNWISPNRTVDDIIMNHVGKRILDGNNVEYAIKYTLDDLAVLHGWLRGQKPQKIEEQLSLVILLRDVERVQYWLKLHLARGRE